MTDMKRWLLPDGVEEILPGEAHKLESLRRELLDLYQSWGYELVITPLIEYLDSLFVGSSHDLDLHTFKITDQLSGRMMGIRADITPQVARIDAHCLDRDGPVRLCYSDNVLHTKPRGLMTSRVPIRIGAELFGHSGEECDVELICLMNQTLNSVGVDNIHIVLGHVGIFRALVREAKLGEATEQVLFDAVQRKAFDEIDMVLVDAVPNSILRDMLQKLTRLSGDESTLTAALTIFGDAPESVKIELQELVTVVREVKQRIPDINLFFDLCELRGYEYHTGIVFAAYTPAYGRAVAKGGRYDHIGEVFGRSRPASGFDSDLKVLAKLSSKVLNRVPGILAPDIVEEELSDVIDKLREQGEIVIVNLGNKILSDGFFKELNCDRELIRKDDSWTVGPITK